MTPEKLYRYEIIRELGKGAMGVVYLARDPIIQRQLAIKTFRMAYAARKKDVEQFRKRFEREARAIGQLSHPNVVTVFDAGEEGDEFFIAMEYIEGIDLKQRFQRLDGPLELETALDIAAQIADGLASAHEKGIVHRDVKPANIIITVDDQVKITDFGIARMEEQTQQLTVAGQLLGTPNYMAPEQIQGQTVDARSDIFSLGVMIYEMLTRRKPFQGENLTQVTHRIVYDAFTPPSEYIGELPPGIMEILDRALAKGPDDRYQDAAEMAADLRQLRLSLTATPAMPATPTAAPAFPEAPETQPPPPLPKVPPAAPTAPSLTSPEPPKPPPVSPPSAPSPSAPPPSAPSPSAKPPVTPRASRPAQPPPAQPPPAQLPPAQLSPAKPAAERGRSRKGLVAALGLAGLVVIIVAAMALLRGGDDPDAQPVEELAESTVPAISTAAEERRRREIELIERAGNLAESGDPAAALDLLRQELSDDPLSVRLPRVYLELAARLEAEAPNIFEVFVEERMLAAQDQIEAQEYEKAGELLERVLFVDPEHAAAKERLEDIEALLKRPSTPSRRPRRAAPPPPPPPEEVTEVALPLPSPPPPPGDLRIVLRTSIAQGTVKVETNEAVLLSESFDYPGRRLIKQKYLKKVQGFEKTVSLASGPVDLRIQIEVDTKDGLKRPSGGLRKTIVPERVHLLTITVDDDASLDLRFE